MTIAPAPAPPKLLRALLYGRVSHDPSGKGLSVDSQLSECRTWAEREDWTVVAEVRDVDRSASRHAKRRREGWDEVCRQVEAGGVDVLVCWEASRANRDLDGYNELRNLCERTDTLWAYSGTVYDLTQRSDRFRTGLDALVAEDEADRISERVRRGVASAAAAGRATGRVPYGYMREYDPATGELLRQVEHPEQAAVIREVAARVLAGESLRRIAFDLNGRGVPTSTGKGTWGDLRLGRLLRSPTVNGQRVHQGKVVGRAEWPAIISDDDWARLQAIFADPSRRTTRATEKKHLLTGIARCGICGGALRYGKDGKAALGQARRTYTCRTVGPKGFHVARDGQRLDAYVVGLVLERLRRADVDLDDVPAPEVLTARAEAEDLRARLTAAADEYSAGRLSITLLSRIEADLTAQITAAERKVRHSGLPSTVAELMDSGEGVEGVWDAMTVEQRREVIRSLMTVVVSRSTMPRGSKTWDVGSIGIAWRR